MSEQPTVPGAEAIANKQAEQPTAPREQAAASDSQVPTEDFEAGVLAQLDSLYRTALRLTNNQQEAEDLVQETMLKAFRFANTYQRGTNLRAWLFRILNTSAINRYRKQASHPQATSLPEGEEFYLYNRIRDFSGQELSAGAEEEVLSQNPSGSTRKRTVISERHPDATPTTPATLVVVTGLAGALMDFRLFPWLAQLA